MSADEKRMSAAEKAAARIAAQSAADLSLDVPPAAPRTSREDSERGVLGRFDRVIGRRARVDRLELDPSRVRIWHLQGRLQDALTADHVSDVVASIRDFGQFVPAIARPISDDPRYTHEIIEGSRRRLACEILRRNLIVYSSELTDLQAAMISQTADDQVKHSPYEVGLRWQGWLGAGIATSAAELAERIGVSRSLMSLRLNMAQIPRPFLRCFGDHDRVPKAIYQRLASLVVKARQADRLDEVRNQLKASAERILPAGEDPNEAMLALAQAEAIFKKRRAPVVAVPIERQGPDNAPLLTVTPSRTRVGIKLAKAIAEKHQAALAEAVADFTACWIVERVHGNDP